MSSLYPLVLEIPFVDSLAVARQFPREGLVWLDSRKSERSRGRYSFLAGLPFQVLRSQKGRITLRKGSAENELTGSPFHVLREQLAYYTLPTLPDFPPFQGGVAGMWGYELVDYLETLIPRRVDDQACPECIIGFYDVVIAWDHVSLQSWIFSSGFPYHEGVQRQAYAQERLEWAKNIIKQAQSWIPVDHVGKFRAPAPVVSTFTPEAYGQAVERVKEYIRAGDIFEANISQRFSTRRWDQDPFDLYEKLMSVTSAPFSAYVEYGHHVILSASPERFLKLSGGRVETRPIKGTRPRDPDPEKDCAYAQALCHSEKDRAENIMIVDLMRNDLSRVCLPHSVHVSQLCALESFVTVHHLVSVVEGMLAPGKSAIDLMEATFPGGSITGAPKIRAMDIIREIEPTVRGPYCGSIGYIGFDGNMDLSIIIRTMVLSPEWLTFHVGGAITIDSDPREEYDETLAKAASLQRALKD